MKHFRAKTPRRKEDLINQLHGRFLISNDDFLYVLSTFVFVPIRWNERFGWRRMIESERIALFHFWREVGRRMNIKEIPADYHEFERYNLDYERRHYRHTESNHRVGLATRNLFMSWFPRWTRPLVKHAIYAAMDEPIVFIQNFLAVNLSRQSFPNYQSCPHCGLSLAKPLF